MFSKLYSSLPLTICHHLPQRHLSLESVSERFTPRSGCLVKYSRVFSVECFSYDFNRTFILQLGVIAGRFKSSRSECFTKAGTHSLKSTAMLWSSCRLLQPVFTPPLILISKKHIIRSKILKTHCCLLDLPCFFSHTLICHRSCIPSWYFYIGFI